MNVYLSEKEQLFIIVQAVENMQRLEREMLEKKKLIKYDNYVQWHNMYKKFLRRLPVGYGTPTPPKQIIIQVSNKDANQMDLVEEAGNVGNENS